MEVLRPYEILTIADPRLSDEETAQLVARLQEAMTGLGIEVARDNAERNQVDALFYLPDALPSAQYAVVIANILSNPLRVLAPMLAGRVQAGGRIVLSGILAGQAEEMRALYGEWFHMQPAILDDGWACLSGTRQ